MVILHPRPSAIAALLGVLAVAVFAGACSPGEEPDPDGPFPPSDECSGCFHVIRDLEFAREIALSGRWLYVADTDGTRLERVDLQSGEATTLVRGEYSPLFLSAGETAAHFVGIRQSGLLSVLEVVHDSEVLEVIAGFEPSDVTYVGVRAGVALGLVRAADGTHLWELGQMGPATDLGVLERFGVSQCIAVSATGAVAWCDPEDGIWVMGSGAVSAADATWATSGFRGSQVLWLGAAAVVTGSEGGIFRAHRVAGSMSEIVVETSNFSGWVGAESNSRLFFFDPVTGNLWSSPTGGPPREVAFDASLFLGDVPLAADDEYLYVAGRGSNDGQVYRVEL